MDWKDLLNARWSLARAVLLSLLLAGTLTPPAQGALIGATSDPKVARVPVKEGRTLQIRWVISTTSAHDTGAFSAQGVLKDAATSTVLKTHATPFNKTEGAGPLRFEESLTITPEEAGEWLQLGYRELHYSRQFSTGSERPTTSQARVTILLQGEDTAEGGNGSAIPFALHHLELGFKPQRFRSQVARGLPLQAQLSVAYAGEGSLEGSWQLGSLDPESGQMRYRELAQVKKELKAGGRDWLLSPQLPTDTLGRHILRFCSLTSLETSPVAMESLCNDPATSASLPYEVVESQPQPEPESAPATLTGDTRLSWPATPETVVYELVLHEHSGKEAVTSSQFVGRLLIPAQQQSTTLSPQLMERLKPGSHYQWQVQALDRHGELIRATAPASFVFLP
ncbi:MAG: hypothetical protein SV765_19075 [Pseudomonadota bacterium]|nr:hypothetical protein [Pseudomonadales bacterium]MDY6922309.1 hypothetical protein [Pseudomonadota bacterium]